MHEQALLLLELTLHMIYHQHGRLLMILIIWKILCYSSVVEYPSFSTKMNSSDVAAVVHVPAAFVCFSC